MSASSQPRVDDGGGLSARARLADTGDEVNDSEIVDLLAAWLAEVSAEASVRPPTCEDEPPSKATL